MSVRDLFPELEKELNDAPPEQGGGVRDLFPELEWELVRVPAPSVPPSAPDVGHVEYDFTDLRAARQDAQSAMRDYERGVGDYVRVPTPRVRPELTSAVVDYLNTPQGGGEFALETVETPSEQAARRRFEQGVIAGAEQLGGAIDQTPVLGGLKAGLGQVAEAGLEGLRQVQVLPRVVGAGLNLQEEYPETAKYRAALTGYGMKPDGTTYTPDELAQLRTASEQEYAQKGDPLLKPETFGEKALKTFEEKVPVQAQVFYAFLDPANELLGVPFKAVSAVKNAGKLNTISKALKAEGLVEDAVRIENTAKQLGLSSQRAARFLQAEADFAVPLKATSDDIISAAKAREAVYANAKDSSKQFFGLVQGKPFNPFTAKPAQLIEKLKSVNPLEMTPQAAASKMVDRAAMVVNYIAARTGNPDDFARVLVAWATDEGRAGLAPQVGKIANSKAGVELTALLRNSEPRELKNLAAAFLTGGMEGKGNLFDKLRKVADFYHPAPALDPPQRLMGAVKNVMTRVLLGVNPAYPAVNLINGLEDMATKGRANPFEFFKSQDEWFDKVFKGEGVTPRASQGVGSAETGVLTATGQRSGVASPVLPQLQGKGILEKLNTVKWAEQIESQMSKATFKQGFEDLFHAIWRENVGIPRLSAELASQLTPQEANLLNRILERNYHYDDILKEIDAAFGARGAGGELFPPKPRLPHQDPDLRGLREIDADIATKAQKAVEGNKTLNQIQREFNLIKNEIRERLSRVKAKEPEALRKEFERARPKELDLAMRTEEPLTAGARARTQAEIDRALDVANLQEPRPVGTGETVGGYLKSVAEEPITPEMQAIAKQATAPEMRGVMTGESRVKTFTPKQVEKAKQLEREAIAKEMRGEASTPTTKAKPAKVGAQEPVLTPRASPLDDLRQAANTKGVPTANKDGKPFDNALLNTLNKYRETNTPVFTRQNLSDRVDEARRVIENTPDKAIRESMRKFKELKERDMFRVLEKEFGAQKFTTPKVSTPTTKAKQSKASKQAKPLEPVAGVGTWAPGDIPPVPYSRVLDEQGKQLFAELEKTMAWIRKNYSNKPMAVQPDKRSAIQVWLDQSGVQNELLTARAASERAGLVNRDFVLHDYTGGRFNFDTALARFFPYHYWVTREGATWAQYLLENPRFITAYAAYKRGMEEATKDLPPQYRDTVRIPFTELRVNPELAFNPVNRWVDYFDLLQDPTQSNVNKGFGALRVMSPFPVIESGIRGAVGEESLAQKTGRLGQFAPVSRVVKAVTGKDIEAPLYAAANKAFGTNLSSREAYEPTYVGRVLYDMATKGQITPQEYQQAITDQSGATWDKALRRSEEIRGVSDVTGFATGIRPRVVQDSEFAIEEAKQASSAMYRAIDELRQRDDLSEKVKEREIQKLYDQFEERYPLYGAYAKRYGTPEERAEFVERQKVSAQFDKYEAAKEQADKQIAALDAQHQADLAKFPVGYKGADLDALNDAYYKERDRLRATVPTYPYEGKPRATTPEDSGKQIDNLAYQLAKSEPRWDDGKQWNGDYAKYKAAHAEWEKNLPSEAVKYGGVSALQRGAITVEDIRRVQRQNDTIRDAASAAWYEQYYSPLQEELKRVRDTYDGKEQKLMERQVLAKYGDPDATQFVEWIKKTYGDKWTDAELKAELAKIKTLNVEQARKSGLDEGGKLVDAAYTELSKIPPGKSDDFWAIVDKEANAALKAQGNKYGIANTKDIWNNTQDKATLGDKLPVLIAAMQKAATQLGLTAPSDAVLQEWVDAEKQMGVYMNMPKETGDEKAARREYWDAHPLLSKYYAGESKTTTTTQRTYASGGGGGGGGGRTSGTVSVPKPSTDLWTALKDSLKDDAPFVEAIAGYLMRTGADADLYAKNNPRLLAWLRTIDPAYLAQLRAAYLAANKPRIVSENWHKSYGHTPKFVEARTRVSRY